MATPHVSGLAALIWSKNPQYTYQDVIESIKNGSQTHSGLIGKIQSGRVVNAMGSLSYIQTPTQVSVSIH